jgi:hypothetical protein
VCGGAVCGSGSGTAIVDPVDSVGPGASGAQRRATPLA